MADTEQNDVVDSYKTTDISAITVNSATLEKILQVSDRRIRQLAEENIIVRVSKGRYRLMESISNYILTLKVSMEAGNSQSVDVELNLDEEKAIHERVKRHISELKLKTMQGELHKSEDVERVMTDMLVSIKSKLLSMPSKLAPMLVARNDIDFIKRTINSEVLEVLNELKDYNAKNFYDDEYVDVEEDEEEDGEVSS
nr:MAG TPA: Protein of unknown function (DUF1441) [Caudoviricetes sp.]